MIGRRLVASLVALLVTATARPELSMREGELMYVASDAATSTVYIPYSLTLPAEQATIESDYRVCMHIANKAGMEMVPLTCLGVDPERILSVVNMPIGEYSVTLSLCESAQPHAVIQGSAVKTSLRVLSLDDVMPQIVPVSQMVGAMADSNGQGSFRAIEFNVEGEPQAVSLMQPCLALHSATNAVLGETCISTSERTFALGNLPIGIYTAYLFLRSTNPIDRRESARATVSVEVHAAEEFVPSYEWRPLREWHTIPSGIETRLPLSAAAHKEARIPERWRLQMIMPKPCKYFLRMDVGRRTSITEIQRAASQHCSPHVSLPPECFQVLANGAPLPTTSSEPSGGLPTVESTDYFNSKKALLVDDSNALCMAAGTTP